MAKIQLEKTIYKGYEGSVVKVKVIATELTSTTTSSLADCSLMVLPSTFFNENVATVGEDVERSHQIDWGEVKDGRAEGLANIVLTQDAIKEGDEGALILLKSKNSKKIKAVTPMYALLLIEEPYNRQEAIFNAAREQLELNPEERTHYRFLDFVVHIERTSFIERVGWFKFLASPVDIYHLDGTRTICGFFSDLFMVQENIYGITVYKPAILQDAYYLEFCRKGTVKPEKNNRIYWENLTEEELLEAVEASGYKNWGEFGNVFGGTANPRRELPGATRQGTAQSIRSIQA